VDTPAVFGDHSGTCYMYGFENSFLLTKNPVRGDRLSTEFVVVVVVVCVHVMEFCVI